MTLPSLAKCRWLKAPSLTRIFDVIEAGGGEVRVAGGAVRNALLKLPVADVDLATDLTPEKVTELCVGAGLKVAPTGIAHGTVTVVSDHIPYEVTTLRHDIETDGRRARVSFTDDWEADAARRDFTMNAMFCDRQGKIYDFTEGYEAVRRKRVIFVGAPRKRIEEDYLRILRFFRFHAQFGHGAPDKAGLAACVSMRKNLAKLSAERVRQEMFKLLKAPGAVPTLKLMAEKSILRALLPHTNEWRTLSRLPPDPVLRLAVLASAPESMRERWRLSNAEGVRLEAASRAQQLTPELRPKERRAMLYHTGANAWRDAVRLAWAKSRAPMTERAWRTLLRLPDRWPIPSMPLLGKDLLAAGASPGPALGDALRRAEDWWIAGDFKAGKDELLAHLRQKGMIG
jgi:poly(A) polymerase